ncbi:hypothetical protein [Polynucleobacter sp. UK-Kesae-W10]|uniref:hypothetical protein n=1 Tax=Polynucleobacter sp. UK-Kesae-W10 TaxID=1819738 RepID=UPI001C0DAE02|nr:hypothetical protein [Polynucleobacter sp. UK-Kesae-W10]MBU3577532.1 hypothetical protein [Polynucleobacter sp. UK-Kesae-W10]
MNCCDSYGNCCQGRDCPVRRTRANKPKPLAPWRISLKGKHISWCLKSPGWLRIKRLIIRWELA